MMLKLQVDRGFQKRFLDKPPTWNSSAEGLSKDALRQAMYSYEFMYVFVLFLAEIGHRLDYLRTWHIPNVRDFMCRCWFLARNLDARQKAIVRTKIERFLYSAFTMGGRLLHPGSWTIRVPGNGKHCQAYAKRLLNHAYSFIVKQSTSAVASFIKAKTRVILLCPRRCSDLFTDHGTEARDFRLNDIEAMGRAEKWRANRRDKVQWLPLNFCFPLGCDPSGFTQDIKWQLAWYLNLNGEALEVDAKGIKEVLDSYPPLRAVRC